LRKTSGAAGEGDPNPHMQLGQLRPRQAEQELGCKTADNGAKADQSLAALRWPTRGALRGFAGSAKA